MLTNLDKKDHSLKRLKQLIYTTIKTNNPEGASYPQKEPVPVRITRQSFWESGLLKDPTGLSPTSSATPPMIQALRQSSQGFLGRIFTVKRLNKNLKTTLQASRITKASNSNRNPS